MDMDEILKQLKELASDDLRAVCHMQLLLNNIDEAATIEFKIAGKSIAMPLIHVEVIEMFNDFLTQAIEYYKCECQ